MKIGIIYLSKTGNTKKLAEIAYEIVKDKYRSEFDIEIKSIEKVDLRRINYDLIIFGSYCDSNSYPRKAKIFFERIKGNKIKLASFVTHATAESGEYYDRWAKGCEEFFYNFCKENNIENLGYFHCQAKPSFAISLFIKSSVFKNRNDWEIYKKDMNRHPSSESIDRFKKFISEI